MSDNPYTAMISLDLSPIDNNIIDYLKLFISSMFDFPDEEKNVRLENLLYIIDSEKYLDIAMKNNKIMRALLALNARFAKTDPYRHYKLYFNCKRVLAHIFKKYPCYMTMNINRRGKRLKFTQNDVEQFF